MVTSLSTSSSIRERTPGAPYFHWAIALLFLAGLISGFFALRDNINPLSLRLPTANPVTAAWQAAQSRGAYTFASDVVQTTTPLAGVANVGKSSREERLHLAGDNDLHAQTMNLRLWSQTGNLVEEASGLEVRVADGKTLIRQPGGEWQERSDFTGALAPNGDLMSYLAGLHTVQTVGAEEKAVFSYTRYRFDLDGPSIAAHLRDQLQATLTQRGELPSGLTLQAPEQFAQMTGVGELWVRSDAAGRGLPLRQILDLRFPEAHGEIVTAHIDTTFRDFAPAPESWLPRASLVQDFSKAALLLGMASGLLFLLIRRRRSRVIYTAVVSAIIAAQVIGPLLHQGRVVTFIDAQRVRAASAEKQQREAARMTTLRTQANQPRVDPTVDPLAAVEGEPALAGTTRLRQSQPTTFTAVDNGVDSDNDGLTDFVEERIGTNGTVADTDGDSVRDGQEVLGFRYNNQQWYGDPIQMDSNRDHLSDTVEWLTDHDRNGLPDDTDGDGLPDLYDPDNDNDGVRDSQDLAPFVRLHPGATNSYFGDTQPLQLTLSDLTPNQLTLVEFQLRPRDPKHLWYALNVLDWPTDQAGQMQDADNATFADVAARAGQLPNPGDANGDLRLIPMLEVRFPRTAANLPSAQDLLPYNIIVNDLTADRSQQVAYVPLNVVTDAESGERQAFQGRMLYRPTGAWNAPHAVRLVWVVQALVDLCFRSADGVCNHYQAYNRPQVIQAYPDEWSLTGLTVREEHGTELAIVYEDPNATAVPAGFQRNDALWALSYGLDRTFLAARDANSDGQRDLTVAEVQRRFDHTTNPAVPATERWQIPNVLRVECQRFDTLDRALASTAMTDTVRILNREFRQRVTIDRTIHPLLLFAREESYRTQSLDSLRLGNGFVTAGGNAITIDMQSANGSVAPVTTLAGLTLASYCGVSGARWFPCDRTEEWNELGRRYAAGLTRAGESAAESAARLTLLRLLYFALAEGVTALVQQREAQSVRLLPYTAAITADTTLADTIGGWSNLGFSLLGYALTFAGEIGDTIQDSYVITLLWVLGDPNADAAANLGLIGFAEGKLAQLLGSEKASKIVGAIVGVLVVLITVALVTLLTLYVDDGAAERALILLPLLAQLFFIIDTFFYVGQLVNRLVAQGVSLGSAVGNVLSGTAALVGSTKLAGVIGTVLSVLTVWGVFIAQVVLSQTTPFSPQFNQLLAGAIATTLSVVIMAVLAATVVGAIALGILALIDTILTAACELGVDALRVGGENCYSFNGSFVTVLTKLLYAYDPMVNTDRSDLIESGALAVQLVDPAKGYVGRNLQSATLPVTTTLIHKDPSGENWHLVLPYLGFWSPDNLRSSTFRYSLSRGVSTRPVERGQMRDEWQTPQVDHHFAASPMYRTQVAQQATAGPLTDLETGINRSLRLFHNTHYALPAYECWLIPIPYIPVCYERSLSGANALPLSQVVFDLLPPTLAEFVTMAPSGDGGLQLGWDPAFTTLFDADGDGLIAPARNGMDPNDTTWDADGDGLADGVELAWRERKVTLSPVLWDSDSDGLSDAQELTIGSHPALADSDNDGLRDGDEVYHQRYAFSDGRLQLTTAWAGGWTVVVPGQQPVTVPVSSDPLTPDSDGDGISDGAERTFAQQANPALRLDPDGNPYHPKVVNANPLALFPAVNDADRIVGPGQTLLYSTTVVNRTAGGPALFTAGLLEVSAPPPLSPARDAQRLALDTAAMITNVTTLTVAPTAANGPVMITSGARTRVVNPATPRWSWQAPTGGTLGGQAAGSGSLFLAATANRPDRQDSYLITPQIRHRNVADLAPVFWKGDLRGYTWPGGANSTLYQTNSTVEHLRTNTAPAVACSEAGRCLTVWDHYDNCRIVTVNNIRIDQHNDEPNGTDIVLYLRRDGNFLRSGQPLNEQLLILSNQPSGRDIGLNRTAELCGPGARLELWETDISPQPFTPDGVGGLTKLTTLVWNSASAVAQNAFFNVSGASTLRGVVRYTAQQETLHVIAGSVTASTPQSGGQAQILVTQNAASAAHRDFSPAIASNGANFLVVWERVRPNGRGGTQTGLVYRRYDAFGGPLGNEVVLGTIDVNSIVGLEAYTTIDLVWTGAHYRLAWKHQDGLIQVMDVDANGTIISPGVYTVATDANSGLLSPRLAYDPHTGRVLLVYRTGNNVRGLLFANARASFGTLLDLGANGEGPQVAYHPGGRGWLVAWTDLFNRQLTYRFLNSDGTPRPELSLQTIAWPVVITLPQSGALRCPAVTALPAVQLPLEELPGATTFADSSGNNVAVTCSDGNCPQAAVTGAPQAPLSDYAVSFNGVNQNLALTLSNVTGESYSVAFWLKTAQTDGNASHWRASAGIVTSADFGISLSGGRLLFGSGERTIQSDPLADDRWHFIVATRLFNQYSLFVDGVPVRSASMPATPLLTPPLPLRIGSQLNNTSFFNGALDHLALYDAALASDTVSNLFRRQESAYCLATAPANFNAQGNAVAAVQLGVTENDGRGDPISQRATLSLTIDADPPTSTVTAPGNQRYLPGSASGEITHIIGGVAQDRYGLRQVDVRVNGGAWQAAVGAASWAFPLTASNGRYEIQSRATDSVGNVETNPQTTVLLVDGLAPVITTAFADGASLHPTRPRQTGAVRPDHYTLSLTGQVNDPAVAVDTPGSGVASVEVLLQDATANLGGNLWQPATVANGQWSVVYQFPETPIKLTPINGVYTVTVRSADHLGNRSEQQRRVQLDTDSPTAALTAQDAALGVITETITLHGVISDVTGVAGLEVAFTPIQRVRALSDTLVYLPFDEPAGADWFQDVGVLQRAVACTAACVAGEVGRSDRGARLQVTDATTPLLLPNQGELHFGSEDSFSIQLWLRTSQAEGTILASGGLTGPGIALHLDLGFAELLLNGLPHGRSNLRVNDDQWHQLVAVVDRAAGSASFFVDGALMRTDPFTGSLFAADQLPTALAIGGRRAGLDTIAEPLGITGWVDELVILRGALTQQLVAFLYNTADSPWRPATLAQPNAQSTTWTIQTPSDLEGQYQLDLRATDIAGNRAVSGYAWRGVIDTLAPRLSAGGEATDNQYVDPATGATQYEVSYSVTARDRHVDLTSFTSPCTGVMPQPDFAPDADMAGLFPDLTVITGQFVSCNLWVSNPPPPITVGACDHYGRCSTLTDTPLLPTASAASREGQTANQPTAMIIRPANSALVSSGTFSVTVVANAEALLREVTLLVDDAPVQTIAFAQADAVKAVQRTVAVTSSDGAHRLTARVTDWAGATDHTSPLSITVDTQAPTLSITGDTLTDADTYNGNPHILRFHGQAQDANGLAAVQIRINDGPYQPATFDDAGNWYTALVLDELPAGDTLDCIVRVIDKAGHITEASKPMVMALSARADLLTTQLTEKSIISRTATFAFTGQYRAGEPAPAFLCRLDGGAFTPCTSPVTHRELADGPHTFQVLALGDNGKMDVTPASYTWRIGNAPAPSPALAKLFLPLVANRTVSVGQAGVGEDVVITAPPTATAPEVGPAITSDGATVEQATAESSTAASPQLLYLPLVSQ